MTDENEQLDEIEVVRSIFGEDVFSCDLFTTPYSGELLIESEYGKGPHEIKCKFESYFVDHLSPISVDVTLPSNYPSSNPPLFQLYCCWMTQEQMDMLTKKLNELWNEDPNCVVLFVWVNFLKYEACQFVDIKFPINVSEDDLRLMTRFSLMKNDKAFGLKVLKCTICKNMKQGCILLEYCEHRFCKECLKKHVTPFMSQKKVDCIICPYYGCTSEVHPEAIKRVVPHAEFRKYDSLLLEKSLEIMTGIYYCPLTSCGKKVIVGDINEECGVCRACKYVFCVKCKLTCHGVAKCTFKEKMTSAKRRGIEKARQQLRYDFTKKRPVTISKMQEGKNCPKCGSLTNKFENCNKAHCKKCCTSFCWLCSKIIDSSNPYKHFENVASHCHNLLYDD